MTDEHDQARSDLRMEEYRMLKAEISTLDARVERGISTVLGINALVLTVVYLGIVPLLVALEIPLDAELLNSLKLPLLYVLILLNAVLGSRYFLMTKHIDKIGGYIARLEREIYRECQQTLGWELSMRDDARVDAKKDNAGDAKKDNARDAKKDNTRDEKKDNPLIDTFRRWIFWIFVAVVNVAAFLDLTCILPLTGVTECPVP